MRISDWSSDLCSSDLFALLGGIIPLAIDRLRYRLGIRCWFNPGSFNNSARRCLRLLLDLLRSLCELLQLQLDVHHCNPVIEQSRSEEHTSELQSLMRISYAVFCLKKKNKTTTIINKYQ